MDSVTLLPYLSTESTAMESELPKLTMSGFARAADVNV